MNTFTLLLILFFLAKCEDGNKTYAINQTYLTLDCKENCKCEFFNGTAALNCSPLCKTPNDPGCSKNNQEVEEYQQPLNGTNCSCPAKRCIPGLNLFRNIQLQIVSKSQVSETKLEVVHITLYQKCVWKLYAQYSNRRTKTTFFQCLYCQL